MNLKHFLYKLILGMCIILLISACQETATENTEPEAQAQSPSPEEVIAHGKYLVTIMGCNDCHSPKRMGEMGPEVIPELMLSGYPSDRPIVKFESEMIREGFGMFYPDLTAAAGPWGVSFAGNLTPDDTGIGTWTEEQFKIALTQGKFKGMENGRPMLPPMPWVNYIDMTDEDIHAVFMYLKSIPAVENVIPPPITPDKM
jgi:mono/diheme cytochrome c family protein